MDLFDYLTNLKKIMADYKLKLTFEVNADSIAIDLCRKKYGTCKFR